MELKFETEKEELEYYRDYRRKANNIIDEIHDLLELDKEYPNRLQIMQCGKKELILLKNSIKKRIAKAQER